MRGIHRTSEQYALIKLRRSLVIVAISYGYFILAFAFWRRGSELPDLTKILTLAGFVIAVVGAVLARSDFGLWLMSISLTLVTIYFVVDPLVTIAWVQLSVLIAILALSAVFLHWNRRRWITLGFITFLTLFNFLSYNFEATSLLRSGSFLGKGSISSLMVLSTSIYALFGWQRMIARAKSNDEQMDALLADIQVLERSQESQRYWRDLVIRVHETTLNTIRSLLTLRDTPLEVLRPEIEKSLDLDRTVMTRARERRSGSVIGAIRAGIDGAALEEKVRIISQGLNLHLDSQVAEVLERVVREALRNSIEHARARSIEINWRTTTEANVGVGERERGRVLVTISDDGAMPSGQKLGGIGTNLVMAKSIRELGGTFSIDSVDRDGKSGTVVRIELPTFIEERKSGLLDFPAYKAIDLGRYMALLTLFGPAMTGVFFFPLLGVWWSGQLLTQLFGFASLLYLMFTTFVRMKRLGWIESSVVALGLLAIIYFLDLEPLTCVDSQPFQWVINSVVYGLFIILLWGKWQVTAVAYPIFLYLVAPFHDLIPQDCNFIFNFPLLNTLFSFLFVAVVFTLVYKTFERVERFHRAKRSQNLELVTEIERNDAAFEKILELDSLARQTIQELALGTEPISSQEIHSLRRIDSQLRAEMQVDPIASAGLTLLAAEFVHAVVAHNHWVEVKSIHGDEDSRPIPTLLRERFLAVASDVPNGSSIQVVVGDYQAELSLRCPGVAPISLRALQDVVNSLADPELAMEVNTSTTGEYVLFIRRRRASQ